MSTMSSLVLWASAHTLELVKTVPDAPAWEEGGWEGQKEEQMRKRGREEGGMEGRGGGGKNNEEEED